MPRRQDTPDSRQLAVDALAAYVRYQGGVVGEAALDDIVHYFRETLCDDTLTIGDIIDDYLPIAQAVVGSQHVVDRWQDDLRVICSAIDGLSVFEAVLPEDRDALADTLTTLSECLVVEIGGSTRIENGRINIARDVIEQGPTTTRFAILHELGHAIDHEATVPAAIKQAIRRSDHTDMRAAELFADAFAALALCVLGLSCETILDGARQALAGHESDGDHPDWGTRSDSIQKTIAGAVHGTR
ncbi:hypothetical protein [Luteimonas sp. RC10]|uniref:hypothetical protein n=1 Tax=Luteimonas sp. RC10 TaxID=2587035 RepID=UPI00160F8029|nr:hypothetical protein [Luteimonas sp. RC10]MBB3344212.1 hypothetical protein [Luteimonas sp. RC10]